MGRSNETFGKKETRSKQDKKRKEKVQKRAERKENKGTGSLDDMLAYVDEFGNITSTPPDLSQRTVIKAEDIDITASRNSVAIDPTHKGIVKFYDTSKGFGFIKDLGNQQDVFFHVNELLEPVAENNKVTFEIAKGPKGLNAVRVKIDR